jgi:hypothetical protein
LPIWSGTCSLAPHFTVRRSAHVCASAHLSFERGKKLLVLDYNSPRFGMQLHNHNACICVCSIRAGTAESDEEPYTAGIVSEPSMVEQPLAHPDSINQPPIDLNQSMTHTAIARQTTAHQQGRSQPVMLNFPVKAKPVSETP